VGRKGRKKCASSQTMQAARPIRCRRSPGNSPRESPEHGSNTGTRTAPRPREPGAATKAGVSPRERRADRRALSDDCIPQVAHVSRWLTWAAVREGQPRGLAVAGCKPECFHPHGLPPKPASYWTQVTAPIGVDVGDDSWNAPLLWAGARGRFLAARAEKRTTNPAWQPLPS